MIQALFCSAVLALPQGPTEDLFADPVKEALYDIQLPGPIEFNDLNNDGYDDLVGVGGFLGFPGFGDVKIAFNDRQGNFPVVNEFGLQVIPLSEQIKVVKAGDLNGDGIQDFVAGYTTPSHSNPLLIWSLGGSNFLPTTWNRFNLSLSTPGNQIGSFNITDLFIEDLDRDNKAEIIFTLRRVALFARWQTILDTYVLRYDSFTNDLVFVNSYSIDNGTHLKLIDWNQDGDLDLICCDWLGKVIIADGDSSNTVRHFNNIRTVLAAIVPTFTIDYEIVDWNQDGNLDIVLVDYDDNTILVFLYGTGDNLIGSESHRIPTAYGFIQSHLTDVDGDDIPELILLGNDVNSSILDGKYFICSIGNNIRVRQYITDGPQVGRITLPSQVNIQNLFTMSDLDRNGTKDIIHFYSRYQGETVHFIYKTNHGNYLFEESGYENSPLGEQVRWGFENGTPNLINSQFTVVLSGLVPFQPVGVISSTWSIDAHVAGSLWLYPGITGGVSFFGGIADNRGEWRQRFSGVGQVPEIPLYAQSFQFDPSSPFGIRSSKKLTFEWGK